MFRMRPRLLSVSSLRSLSRAYSSNKTLRRPLQSKLTTPKLHRLGRSSSYVIHQHRTYAEKVIKVPEMAESISEGTLKQFSKSVGDYVEMDEEIATIETDKIDVSVNATAAGTIKEFLVSEEDTVTVGQDIAKIDEGAEPEAGKKADTSGGSPKKEASQDESQKPDSKDSETKPPESKETKKPESSKTQEKPAPEAQPSQTQGNALQDSQKSVESSKPSPKKTPSPQSQTPQRSPVLGSREEHRQKMTRIRERTAERLKQSQNTAAALTTFQKVDMSALKEFRRLYKDDMLKKTGVKLGFMGAFTRASVLAMKDFPLVNASIEGSSGSHTVVYRDYVDVSVAVSTDKGLVTPIVRNAESLDIMGIESAISELGKKARDNKLTMEDMAGGTFTISNGGVFGSLFGTPIINLPQTAILGLHAINDEPVVVNGQIVIRPIMYLALTYDHRLLDGREAVSFLVRVKNYIEEPSRMLLG